jgi:hypothetical protein
MALSTTSLAKVIAAQGDTTTARVLYEESVLLAMKADDKLNIASALEGLASIVATQGAYTWAARLWGAAEALRQAHGLHFYTLLRTRSERYVAAARADLGEQAFASAWAEGQAMALEQAIAYALEDAPEATPPAPPPGFPHAPLVPAGASNREEDR